MPSDVPMGYLEVQTKAINEVTEVAQQAARSVIDSLLQGGDYENPVDFVDDALEALEPIFESLTQDTATLSAQAYDIVRLAQLEEAFGAIPYQDRDPTWTRKAMIGAAHKSETIDAFIDALLNRLDYEAKRAAGSTQFKNGAQDKKGKPRFARVPTGKETCPFCIMLASRGYVYHSSTSAGQLDHYHAHCDCRVVPSFGRGSITGYDPDKYLDQYAAMLDNGKLSEEGLARSATNAKLRRREEASIRESATIKEIREDLASGDVLVFDAKGPSGDDVEFGIHPIALDNLRVGLEDLGFGKGQNAELAREIMRRSSGHSFKKSSRGHGLYEQNIRMRGPDGKIGRVLLTWKMRGGSAILVNTELLKMGANK